MAEEHVPVRWVRWHPYAHSNADGATDAGSIIYLPVLDDGGPLSAGASDTESAGAAYRNGSLNIEAQVRLLMFLTNPNNNLEGSPVTPPSDEVLMASPIAPLTPELAEGASPVPQTTTVQASIVSRTLRSSPPTVPILAHPVPRGAQPVQTPDRHISFSIPRKPIGSTPKKFVRPPSPYPGKPAPIDYKKWEEKFKALQELQEQEIRDQHKAKKPLRAYLPWNPRNTSLTTLLPPKTINATGTINKPNTEERTYVTGLPLIFIIVALMLAIFLMSLDRTIISTAIPYITHEFHSTPHIGWYGSSYLLTACTFQPMFGRIFTLFEVKKAYLLALGVFMLGSLICGIAFNSTTLIVGRAIAGFGSAGITTGSFVVVAEAVPLQSRPIFMALVGLMFGVGATAGPFLGGFFTDFATWRWCFFINLPIGAVTAIALACFFRSKPSKHSGQSIKKRIASLDITGNILLTSASVMLFLALSFTSQGRAWSNKSVVALLIGCFFTALAFVLVQWFKQERALMPPRILNQRTVSASCGMALMTYGALINMTFFLPVWFQAIKGVTATRSGVYMIPYFVVNGLFSILAGIFVSKIGYTTPPAVVGSAVGTVGVSLITLLRPETSTLQWVGYQIVLSAGFGMSIQQGFTSVQTVLVGDDVSIGTAAVISSQSLGGALFLSIGNTIFQSRLIKASSQHLIDIDVKELIDGGAAAFRNLVPPDKLPTVLKIYNKALTDVFTMSIPLGILSALMACFIEWKSVKKPAAKDQESGDGTIIGVENVNSNASSDENGIRNENASSENSGTENNA